MRIDTAFVAAATGGVHHGPIRVVGSLVVNPQVIGDEPDQLYVGALHQGIADDSNLNCRRAAARAVPYITEDRPVGGTAIAVPDSERACLALADALDPHVSDRRIAIAGSVGKTTTRALITAAVGTTFAAVESPLSYNTELTLPLTLMLGDETIECFVIEIGARYVNQVGRIARAAHPSVGVLLAVGWNHLSTFGSAERLAETKAEIITSLPASATGVVHRDPGPLVQRHLSDVAAALLTYGEGGDVVAESVSLDEQLRPTIAVATPWGRATARPPCAGLHNTDNVLAAIAAAAAVGVSPTVAAEAMADAVLEPHRMAVKRRADGLTVIDDSYNSSTLSMIAGLRSLAEVPAARRIAVLGAFATDEAIESAYGPVLEEIARHEIEVIPFRTDHYGVAPVHDVGSVLRRMGSGADTAVLVKGGRSQGMERVARTLLAACG